MYTEFLESCTEKQLHVFIDSLMVGMKTEIDRANGKWLLDTHQLIIDGIQATARFGVVNPWMFNQTTPNFWDWHRKNRDWWVNLPQEEAIEWLKGMPWNRGEG